MAEILDVVDLNDNVVKQASYEDVYRNSFPHRIVHVLLFTNDNKMVLQKRSKHKSYCPHHWSTAVGGHVQAGETYEVAAARECQEELGVNCPLEFLYKDKYVTEKGIVKFLSVFKTEYNGTLNPNPEEIEDVKSFTIKQIKSMIEKGEKFHPELLFILKKL